MRKILIALLFPLTAFAIGSSRQGVYPSDPPFGISLTDGSTGTDIGQLILKNGSTGNALSIEIRNNQVDGDQRTQLINANKSEIGQLILQTNSTAVANQTNNTQRGQVVNSSGTDIGTILVIDGSTANSLTTQIRNNQSNHSQVSQVINSSGTELGSLILNNTSTGVSNQVNGTQRSQLVNTNNSEIGQLILQNGSTGNSLSTQIRDNQSNNTQKSQLINSSGTDVGSLILQNGTTGNSISIQIRDNQSNHSQMSQMINSSGTELGSILVLDGSTANSISTQIRNNQSNNTQRSQLINSSGTDVGSLILASTSTGVANQTNHSQMFQLINSSGTELGSLILANTSTAVSNQTNRTQKTQISNGTVEAAVKNGVAALASDPAIVMSISPNNTVGVVQSSTPWLDDITRFGGTNLSTGTGNGGAGIPRVTVSQDSKVNLWDGTNTATVKAANVGATNTDTSIVMTQSPSLYRNINTAATTVVKSGIGVFNKLCVNILTAAATITLYDNTAGSGTQIAAVTLGSNGAGFAGQCMEFNAVFNTGLTAVTTGTVNFTVTYK